MGVVQNSIDIQKIIEAGGDPTIAAKVAELEAEIGDENSGIIKDIDDLQEANSEIADDLKISTLTYSAKASSIDTVTRAQILTSGNVHTCRLDFTVGELNIPSWTADLISFDDVNLYCIDLVAAIRDATDNSKSTVCILLLNKIDNHVGFTTNFQLLATHKYQISFTYINSI